RAVTAVPVAVRFLRRIDATVVQWQERLRTFLRLLGTTISRRTALTFVAAGMRRRIDAILPHGEAVVRTGRQLLGNLRPRQTTLTLVVAGLVGLVLILILLLLEISLRMELAKEASDAAIDVTSAPSARPQKMEFGDAFPTQPTGSIKERLFNVAGRSSRNQDFAPLDWRPAASVLSGASPEGWP